MNAQPNPNVVLRTELGDTHIELLIGAAPISSVNFLACVDRGRPTGASFCRAMRREH